jgi:hypothetical protein
MAVKESCEQAPKPKSKHEVPTRASKSPSHHIEEIGPCLFNQALIIKFL